MHQRIMDESTIWMNQRMNRYQISTYTNVYLHCYNNQEVMNKYKSMCVQFPILNSNLNVISIANILKRETY